MHRARRIAALFAVLAITATAGLPARAAEASCGGTSPLGEPRCSTGFTPETKTITIDVTASVTFVGVIEVRVTDGVETVGFPCVMASTLTECSGTIEGVFKPGKATTLSAEVFTLNRIATLPREDTAPSAGDWEVTATG